MNGALLLVDIQPDFLPGGALAVAGADAILAPIDRLLRERRFACVVATQDWHPAGHLSFASRHPGKAPFATALLHGHEQVLWPDHCVQGTPGASLCDGVSWEVVDLVLRKGSDPSVDSYSAFRHNWNAAGERPPTGLAGCLREREVERVYLCGLARDVCVRCSAEDAADLGFEAFVLWDLTRAVDPATDTAVRSALTAHGVGVINAADLGAL